MKIVLCAFGNRLMGVMEVPEETGVRFRLAMIQPISVFNSGNELRDIEMNKPINVICKFEWTGKTFLQDGHDYDGAREYQLVDIIK